MLPHFFADPWTSKPISPVFAEAAANGLMKGSKPKKAKAKGEAKTKAKAKSEPNKE